MNNRSEDVEVELDQLRNEKIILAGGSIAWWPCFIGENCSIGNAIMKK